MKLGIVVSETYWEEITSKMLDLATVTAKELGASVEVVKVPGSFDIPLAVKKILGKVDGVVTLGAVVQGDTAHDEVICHAVADALIRLALESGKPVVLGVNGSRMSYDKAVERIGRAVEVTKACVEIVHKLQKLDLK